MSILTRPLPGLPFRPARPLTVDEYHGLLKIGALTSGAPYEFLEGWLIPKMSRNPAHDLSLSLVNKVISRVLPSEWFARVQSAITTADSEPEPDVAVVLSPERQYVDHHPGPSEIGLVIEVADSSLPEDRGVKSCIYSRAGIAEYWIVNIADRQVEVYTDPTGPADEPDYQTENIFSEGGSVPLILGGNSIGIIAVSDVLP
jgi:Uma2 family endonuclease